MKQQDNGNGRQGLSSIGDVVELLKPDYPSVTASSLRFLERIGLVVPARTPGGHRLFQPEDIERIRTIKRLQEERYTLEEIAERLRPGQEGLAIDLNAFLARALTGDAAGATHLVAAALDRGLTSQALFDSVLSPALTEVGDRWAVGQISVAQEHAASEIIRDLVAIIGAPRADARGDTPGIVAAAVAGERHVIGLHMVSTLLRQRGFNVNFLGPDVAPTFLTEAVQRSEPAVVMLTATMPAHLPAVESAISAVRNAGSPVAPTVVVGGQIARVHADRLAPLGAVVVPDQETGTGVDQVQQLMVTRLA